LRSSFPSGPGVPHAVPNRSMISRRRVAKNHLHLVLQLTRLPAKLCRHDHSSCLSLVVICSSSMGVVETFPIWPSTSGRIGGKQLKPSCFGVAVLEGLLGDRQSHLQRLLAWLAICFSQVDRGASHTSASASPERPSAVRARAYLLTLGRTRPQWTPGTRGRPPTQNYRKPKPFTLVKLRNLPEVQASTDIIPPP
jgi:hypothetical protein